MNIKATTFWGNNGYNHPPLAKGMVLNAEKELGLKLPPLLIELLMIQNGGYTQGFAFPMTQKTTWAEDHVPLHELFGIVTDKSISTPQNLLLTTYMTEEWGLPPKQVLLSGDGHYWITLDYRKSDVPTVRWIDTECDEDIHVANSFDDFIEGLVSDETFAD